MASQVHSRRNRSAWLIEITFAGEEGEMDCRRDHFHLTAQSSYSIGERANPDVASAPLLNILRDGGYKGEAAIHPALVGNSMVDTRCRAKFNHLLCLTAYLQRQELVGLPGLFLRAI